jgi:hypothetical protein
MEASDKDGLIRGHSAVLWPPADRTVRRVRGAARDALRTAWTDSGRTAIVFYSERARRAHLTYPELTEQVARVAALRRGVPEAVRGRSAATPTVLSYVKKPLRHNEVAGSSGAFEPEANRSEAS